MTVRLYLQLNWSSQQIASILKSVEPDDSGKTVSDEAIYNALYLHPRGELKREMIACLRHHDQDRFLPVAARPDPGHAEHPHLSTRGV